eukprot:TRINITY_DN75722_c0_g1_i1.p1 TRINITY_DN75722_c0_g1~~TRINITY_DN75722_c0_g1_i1.p1  ORF type:complete len:464 (-),score=97.05 TRINITY_DN75722_c0_g1_i1:109-1446(-)
MEFVKSRAPEAPSSLEHSFSSAPWNQATPLPPQPSSWGAGGGQQQAFGASCSSQPQASALPTPSGLVNTLSIPEYRNRIIQIYSVHRPDNVGKVDYLLQKYTGEEEFLYQSICQKYSIDPAIGLPQALPPPAPRPPPPPRPLPWATAGATQGTGVHVPVRVKPPGPRPGPWQRRGGVQNQGFVPPPPALTRAGLGYAQPSVVPPRVQHEAPPQPSPAPAPPMQKHEVMEWDPAKGEMVATTVDLQSSEIQELMGIISQETPSATNTSDAGSTSKPPDQTWQPAYPPSARKEEENYDPFSSEPVQTQPSKPLDMVEIDYLLLGEASGFFEMISPDAGGAQDDTDPSKAESAPVGLSRASTADAMEVETGTAPMDSAGTVEADMETDGVDAAKVESAAAVKGSTDMEMEGVDASKVASSAGSEGCANMDTEDVAEVPLDSDPYLATD